MSGVGLYQIAGQYMAAAAALQDLDLPPEVIADTLEGMSGDLDAKVEARCFVVGNMDAAITGIEGAIEKMCNRLKAAQDRRKWLADDTMRVMVACGVLKVETPFLKITVGNNPPSVVVLDAALIPAAYMRHPAPTQPPPSPDKTAIKAAITAGLEVPGASLVHSQKLVIK